MDALIKQMFIALVLMLCFDRLLDMKCISMNISNTWSLQRLLS